MNEDENTSDATTTNEAFAIEDIIIEDIDDEVYYSGLLDEGDEVKGEDYLNLPAVWKEYTNSAIEVSKYNTVPAALTFAVLLGQLCKDMVLIPSGKRRDDTRIHFLWIQTSGTGKSEMWNFFGPISDLVFQMIEATYGNSDGNIDDSLFKHGNSFSIMDVDDVTDAGLIGSISMQDVMVDQENGPPIRTKVAVKEDGVMEGQGLCAYDEFEYSGVFKQSQHKENVLLYMNRAMNSKWGRNFIIKKKLKDGEIIECNCQRSFYATTYIPTGLSKVIAEKGGLQRMLIFIWDVPQEIQDEIRNSIIDDVGVAKDGDIDINRFANTFLIIYDTLRKRFNAVGQDPSQTVRFSKEFNEALRNEFTVMKRHVMHSRPEVLDIAGNFITRLLGTLTKLSVLCSIAEAPSIKDESKRFIVTPNNVQQASSLVRQCYKLLVSWLDSALKVQPRAMAELAGVNDFIEAYMSLRTRQNPWVNKSVMFAKVRENTSKGQSTIYRQWHKVESNFETKMFGNKTSLKLKEKRE